MSPSITFAASATTSTRKQSIYTPPVKKQKMSITQTYYLAHSARGKLSKEAARGDHDLRLLVGHANMLDSLMIDLANAEQEQERWFNQSLTGAREEEPEVHHEATIVEEPEADWEAEDAESTDEETEFKAQQTPDFDMEDEDAHDEQLALIRTPSRHSPPELTLDSDSDSEDEHMPPSPPNASLDSLSKKQRQAIATTSFYEEQKPSISPVESTSFEEDGFYLPAKPQPTIIAAF